MKKWKKKSLFILPHSAFVFTATPFKLGATLNQTLPVSQQKNKFDLQASLARPMTWKPHTGKLKPLKQENLYTKNVGAYRIDPKNVKVQSK